MEQITRMIISSPSGQRNAAPPAANSTTAWRGEALSHWRGRIAGVALLFVSVFNGFSQAPLYEWAVKTGGIDDVANWIGCDQFANCYVARRNGDRGYLRKYNFL